MSDIYSFKCLGKRNNLESDKCQIISTLSTLYNINFENVNTYNNRINNDTLKKFIKWVSNNKKYSTVNEVVSNIESTKTILDLARTTLDKMNNIILQMRETVLLMSNTIIKSDQHENYYIELMSMCDEIDRIYTELCYNEMNVFNKHWYLNDNFNLCLNSKKCFIILPLCPNINHIEDRDEWNLDKWVRNASLDMECYGNYSIIQNLLNRFKIEYESKDCIHKKSFIIKFIEILDIICKILYYESNQVQLCYKQLCNSKENILNQLEIANKHLEKQRLLAKTSLEKDLLKITNKISYMSVCINSNINTI